MKIHKAILLMGLLLIASTAFTQIKFEKTDLPAQMKKAEKANKLVFVDFRASWCKPCLQMERTTFQDSVLGSFVNTKMVAYKADTDLKEHKALLGKYKISSIPTILLIDPKDPDKPLLRMVGYIPASILLDDLRSVKDKNGKPVF